MGAGWSQFPENTPTNMYLAIKFLIPWSWANDVLTIRASLVGEDSQEPVDAGKGPVVAEGQLEMGRPPGLRRGTPLDAALVLRFLGTTLPQGSYAWKIELKGVERARIPIQALPSQSQ